MVQSRRNLLVSSLLLASQLLAMPSSASSDCVIFADSFESPPKTIDCPTPTGLAFKGPFVAGATVTITALDKTLQPTSKTRTSTLSDGEGQFSIPTIFVDETIEIEVSGRFFDEISDRITTEPITLKAITQLTSEDTVTISPLTDLATARIRALVSAGETIEQAITSASTEIFNAIFGSSPTLSDLSTIGPGSDRFDALMAFSALVLTNSDGPVSVSNVTAVLSLFRDDFADGVLGNAEVNLKNGLVTLANQTNGQTAQTHLSAYYQQLGATVTIPNPQARLDDIKKTNGIEVTINPVGAGTVSEAGTQWVTTGSGLNLSLIPEPGHLVSSVESSCGGQLTENRTRFAIDPINEACQIDVVFEAGGVTLTFDTDGGSALPPISLLPGTSLQAPNDPSKVGHTFTGWQPPLPDKMPAQDLTVKAQWSVNTYTVSFDTEGGEPLNPMSVAFGAPLSSLPTPSRGDFEFAGWSPTPPETMPAEDVLLTAQWLAYPVQLIFDTQGASPIPTIATVAEASVEAPEDPTRSGYTFSGWDPDLTATAPLADTTYTAIWTPRIYALSLDKQDGGGARLQLSGTFDTEVSDVTAPTRPGYDFKGYFTEPDGQGDQWFDSLGNVTAEYATWKQTRNVLLYAHWTPKDITINFLNIGNPVVFNTGTYTAPFGAPVPDFGEPTQSGYTFLGWGPELPQTMPADSLFVSPTWAKRNFTLTLFPGRSSTQATTQTVPFDEPTSVPDPTRTGHRFLGWEPSIPNPMWAKDSQHYATWEANTYTVSFDANDPSDGSSCSPSAPAPIDVVFGTYPSQSLSPLTCAGFNFAGYWDTPSGPGTIYFDALGGSSAVWDLPNNATLYARWTQADYILSFNMDGGISVPAQTHPAGGTIEAPTVTDKLGYTLGGWEDADGASFTFPNTMPAANTTLKAVWVPETYTATFLASEGTDCLSTDTCPTETMTYGQPPPTADVPTKTGFAFLGYWLGPLGTSTQVYSAEGQPVSAWEITAEFELYDSDKDTFYLYPNWARQNFTLDFELGYTPPAGSDITAPSAITQAFESDITPPIPPERTGYTLARWEDANGHVGIPETMPAQNRTYTAYWTQNSYTITFDGNGGTNVTPIEVAYAETINLPSPPTRAGYTFDGWIDANGDPAPSAMPSKDLALKAQWVANTYTVTLDHQGGTSGTDTITVTFDAVMPKVTAPTKANATFAGYWTEKDGQGQQIYQSNMTPNQVWREEADTTIYAYWISDAQFTVNIIDTPSDGGTASGAGTYFEEATVTLEAVPTDPYVFVGWYESDELVSDSPSLTFSAQRDRNLVARFTQTPTAPVVQVTPQYPSSNFDLHCEIVTASTDADGDGISYEYLWTRQLTEQSPAEVMADFTTSTVPATATSTTEIWSCEAYASDGWTLSQASSCISAGDCERKILIDDWCQNSPCQNGGICQEDAVQGTWSCDCSGLSDPPRTGTQCEYVDACAVMEANGDNPCGNFGVCQNDGGGYRCACTKPTSCACCDGFLFEGLSCAFQGLSDSGSYCESPSDFEAFYGPFD